MSDIPDRPVSPGWYGVAFGLVGIAIAIALTGWNQMREVVETLQRKPMPGSHEVALAGGRATIYYEPSSTFDNVDYATPPDMAFTCTLKTLSGKPHPLVAPLAKASYSAGPYEGRAMFDVEVTAPGEYTLTCAGPQRFVVAVGGGIGAWRIVAIAGALVPGTAGLIVVALVTIRRRRWYARKREAG